MRRELRWRRFRRLLLRRDRAPVREESAWHLDQSARVAVSRFYDVLDRLSASDRSIFVLRQIEGLGYAEMAEILGIPVAAVKHEVTRIYDRVGRLVSGEPLLAHYVAHDRPPDLVQQEGA
jgi:RNA polymerase sigma factor (sigma-70 family)